MSIADRLRTKMSYAQTGKGSKALFREAATTIDALVDALTELAKHADNMEAQNPDYHALGEDQPCRSRPLADALFLLREIEQ